jgi:hypothetical protein
MMLRSLRIKLQRSLQDMHHCTMHNYHRWEITMSKENKESLAEQLAEKIRPTLKIDPTTGTTEVSVDTVFADNLPEGVTKEHYEKIAGYEADFTAGLVRAFGETAVDAAATSPDLLRASVTYPTIGKDRIKASFERVSSRPGEKDEKTGERATIVTNADVTVSIDKYADHHVGEVRLAKIKVKDYWNSKIGTGK